MRTCLKQDVPLFGHEHSEGNAQQSLCLLARHNEDIKWWMSRKHRTKFISVDVLSEMRTLVGTAVMRAISQQLHGRKFSFIIDETADCKGQEQVVLVVRTISPTTMVAEETFLGWYATDSQDSEALTNLARDSLLKSVFRENHSITILVVSGTTYPSLTALA